MNTKQRADAITTASQDRDSERKIKKDHILLLLSLPVCNKLLWSSHRGLNGGLFLLFFYHCYYSFPLSLFLCVSALNLLLMSGAAHTHTFMPAHTHTHSLALSLSNTFIGGFKSNRGAASWLGGSGADEQTAMLEWLSIGRVLGVLSVCLCVNIWLTASQPRYGDAFYLVHMHIFICT